MARHDKGHQDEHQSGGADEIAKGSLLPQDPTVHSSDHADGGADEITSALDKRAYPTAYGTSTPTAGIDGRLFVRTDQNVIWLDKSSSWQKVGVADHADLNGKGADDHHTSFTATDHDGRDHSAVASTMRLDELSAPTSDLDINNQDLNNVYDLNVERPRFLKDEDSYYIGQLNSNGKEMIPLLHQNYSDHYQGATVDSVEYWDGSQWVDWSSKVDDMQLLFNGTESDDVLVSKEKNRFRVIFQTNNSYPKGGLIIVRQLYTGSRFDSFDFKVERDDDSTFSSPTTLCDTSFPREYFNWIFVDDHSNETWYRIEIDSDATDYVRWAFIKHYVGRVQDGRYRGLPFKWSGADEDITTFGDLTVGNNLDMNNGNINDVASIDGGGDTVQFDDILDLNSNDLEDAGTTIWDTSAQYIPQGRLQSDSLTVNANNALTGGGSVSLGGSVGLAVDESAIDHNNLTNSGDNDAHHSKYTDTEARNAVTGNVDAADLTGSSGSPGQVLETDGNNASWTDVSATDTHIDILDEGNLVVGDANYLDFYGYSLNEDSGGATIEPKKETIQDYAWDVLTGTQTLINVTHDDSNNEVDFVVQESNIDHNSLTNSDDNDAHHSKTTSGEIDHDSTTGGTDSGAHHTKTTSGEIDHDSTTGGTDSDAHHTKTTSYSDITDSHGNSDHSPNFLSKSQVASGSAEIQPGSKQIVHQIATSGSNEYYIFAYGITDSAAGGSLRKFRNEDGGFMEFVLEEFSGTDSVIVEWSIYKVS